MKNINSVFKNAISKFRDNNLGSVAPIIALVSPLLLAAGGLSMDYAFMFMKQSEMQNAADTAAIAATREIAISLNGTKHLAAVVDSFVTSSLDSSKNLSIASAVEGTNKNIVAVKLKLEWKPFFAQMFNADVTPIVVTSRATLAGTGKICVLGLMEDTLAGVHLDNKSKLSAKSCGVYSNSTSVGSIRTDGSAQGVAHTFCTAGGYRTYGSASLTPKPVVDCNVISDPLLNRAKPSIGGCKVNNLEVTTSRTLSPGTYCGGLTISGTANVRLQPGVYVIKDGPLLVKDSASMSGTGVGFFLTGDESTFNFASGSHINLSAPTAGNMAGLLFYEDQNVDYTFDFNPFALAGTSEAEKKTMDARYLERRFGDTLPEDLRIHRISSNDAKQLLGTIYLARSILLVDANAPVAHESAYTAIVVGRLWLREGPTLVLNADYSVTDVPVPMGLSGQRSRLIE